MGKQMSHGRRGAASSFDVVFGIDMETDIGSFTSNYEGVKHGTPRLLALMRKHGFKATFFWTAHAAEHNPGMVRRVRAAGHEIGCHGYVHETLGDPLFPLPNNWPILPSEVEGRLTASTRIVQRISGVRPVSFRCPRLWGSTQVVNVLEQLGYVADASYPLYFHGKPFAPYHPSARDWTREGRLRIVEIPNVCNLSMRSTDRYHRDRDGWPLFRTQSARALMRNVDGYLRYVLQQGQRPCVCLYFHPWEFHAMPQGWITFGEASVKPLPFIVQNCGRKAVEQFDALCGLFRQRGARILTAAELAAEY